MSRRARSRVLHAVGAELGLRYRRTPTFIDTHLGLAGTVEGHRVIVTWDVARRQAHPRCIAILDPPLDLGLVVRKAGLVDILTQDVLGRADVQLGHDRIDDLITARGDEADRVRALLDHEVVALLLDGLGQDVEVRDHEVSVDASRNPLVGKVDAAWVVRWARHAARLAAALDRRRDQVPPAADVGPLADAVQALAAARELTVRSGAPLRAHGVSRGVPIAVASRRLPDGGGHALLVELHHPERFGFELSIATAAAGWPDWTRPRSTGDAAFDRAFDVSSDAPDRLAALLTPAARAEILSLGEGRRLDLDEARLRITDDARDVDPAAFGHLLDRAVDLVTALARNVAGVVHRGYR